MSDNARRRRAASREVDLLEPPAGATAYPCGCGLPAFQTTTPRPAIRGAAPVCACCRWTRRFARGRQRELFAPLAAEGA